MRPTDDLLLARARQGDAAAFASLLREHDEAHRRLAFRLVGERGLMDDALQEAYVRAFRALPRFGGRSSFGTWLYRIVYNACLDELRRVRGRREVSLSEREGAAPESADERLDLAAALAALPVELRAVVLLVDAEGLVVRGGGGGPRHRARDRRLPVEPRAGRAARRAERRSEMSQIRDEELGRTLLELEVPGHRPGFDEELVRRLTAAPRRRLRLLPAAAVALALPVVAAVVLLLPSGGTEVASAAELRERVSDAVGSASTISGIFVNREQPSSGRDNRWRFVVADSGSFRIAALDSPSVLAYDAATNVESSSDEGLFVTRVGLAPGPPDAAAARWVVQRGLGSVVAALAADNDADVTEIQYRQRPAWQVRVPTGNPGEERLIVVDRETGIPVRSALFRNGVAGAEWRIDQLRVNEPADESFTQTPSARQTPMRYDMGFRRVELEDVANRVGYRALVPEWLPDGFERGEVAVADRARPTGGEAHRNPESREVVSRPVSPRPRRARGDDEARDPGSLRLAGPGARLRTDGTGARARHLPRGRARRPRRRGRRRREQRPPRLGGRRPAGGHGRGQPGPRRAGTRRRVAPVGGLSRSTLAGKGR